jgi:hypothetical protein
MFVKYTYPVTGDISLPEHWPIVWDRYRVTWDVKDGKAEGITLTVQTDDLSGVPKITMNPKPGISADIHLGHQPYHDEVESILRTAAGLLGFFARADIDFDRPTVSWEAENEKERELLQLHRWSTERGEPPITHAISYDLVARCFLAAIPASEREIPLRFLAKGRREMQAGHFIDAYYNLFFFFETQFAAGYSSPRKVAAKFKQTPEIMELLARARAMLQEQDAGRLHGIKSLLAKSDAELIDHLVDLRGMLHHHAMPRRKGRWHPEKHDAYEAEATVLFKLASIVAQHQNIPVLFSDSVTKAMYEGAKREGADFVYLVEAKGFGSQSGKREARVEVHAPGKKASYLGLQTIEDKLRKLSKPLGFEDVREYTIKSADGSELFATYKNHLPDS